MNKKQIFSNQYINNITLTHSELFDEMINYDSYLKIVFKKFNSCLSDYFGEDYIFSKAYYLQNEDSPLTTIGICPKNEKNKVFYDGILEAEHMTTTGEASSLAAFVVTNFKLGVLIYKSEDDINEQIDEIIYHNFNDVEDKQFINLDIKNKSNTTRMVAKHNEMAELSGYKKLFSYVLRTRNLDKDFNGTLYIVFHRELEINEYRELIDVFTHIMQARIKYEYKKEILNRSVIDELSHSWKHIFGALHTEIRQISDSPSVRNDPKSQLHAKKALKQIKHLNSVNNFLLNLMRVGKGAENFKNLDEKRVSSLERHIIPLKKSLITVADILSHSLELLGLGEDGHQDRIKDSCIPILLSDINALENIEIEVIPTGLEIILLEVLKNAVFHTNAANPIVRIYYKEHDEEFMALHFTNNQKASLAFCEYINDGKNVDGMAKQYKAGIRTVKRILSHPLFNYSDKLRWMMRVDEKSLNEAVTNIFIKIPKADLI